MYSLFIYSKLENEYWCITHFFFILPKIRLIRLISQYTQRIKHNGKNECNFAFILHEFKMNKYLLNIYWFKNFEKLIHPSFIDLLNNERIGYSLCIEWMNMNMNKHDYYIYWQGP